MIPKGNPINICVHDYPSQCLVNLRSPGRQRAIHKQHRRHQNGLTCHWLLAAVGTKKLFTLLDLCVSSLRRGHANLLCIVPILTADPRRESKLEIFGASKSQLCVPSPRSGRSPHTTAVCGGCSVRSWPRRPAESWVHLGYGSRYSEYLPADGLETLRYSIDAHGYTQNTCRQTI